MYLRKRGEENYYFFFHLKQNTRIFIFGFSFFQHKKEKEKKEWKRKKDKIIFIETENVIKVFICPKYLHYNLWLNENAKGFYLL